MSEPPLVVGFVASTLRLSVPLILASTGELVAERAGILNLSVEGMMLTGALAGFLGAHYTGSLLVGWLLAILAGAAVASIFGIFTICLRTHQVITALGINLLAVGATGFIYRTLFGFAALAPQVTPANPWAVPFLNQIPWLGMAVFSQTPLGYLAFALPPIVAWLLFRTPLGLSLRAVGENASAADAMGISVVGIRFGATIFGGMLAGLSGAYLSTTTLNVFLENMTGGLGWIAVAIVIFGNWKPRGAVVGALVFGGAEALQLRLQALGIEIPREFIVMLPYVLTLAALAGLGRKSRSPAQLCVPFFRTR
ncbi:MAG: ABC transporter permease [Verrucomicrobiota bacterium]